MRLFRKKIVLSFRIKEKFSVPSSFLTFAVANVVDLLKAATSCDCPAKSALMKNSFFMRIIPLWNSLPLMLFKEKYSIETIKSKLKRYFIGKIAHEIEHPEYRKKCWRDYRF